MMPMVCLPHQVCTTSTEPPSRARGATVSTHYMCRRCCSSSHLPWAEKLSPFQNSILATALVLTHNMDIFLRGLHKHNRNSHTLTLLAVVAVTLLCGKEPRALFFRTNVSFNCLNTSILTISMDCLQLR